MLHKVKIYYKVTGTLHVTDVLNNSCYKIQVQVDYTGTEMSHSFRFVLRV